jgi:hypothetical protein
MDKGNIAEFASPAELLRDHKSKFYAVSPPTLVPDKCSCTAMQSHWQDRVQESEGAGNGCRTQQIALELIDSMLKMEHELSLCLERPHGSSAMP